MFISYKYNYIPLFGWLVPFVFRNGFEWKKQRAIKPNYTQKPARAPTKKKTKHDFHIRAIAFAWIVDNGC